MHCGAVAEHRVGSVIIFRPQMECCAPAIQHQIKARQQEIHALKNAAQTSRNNFKLLENNAFRYGDSKSDTAVKVREQWEAAAIGIEAQMGGLALKIKSLNDEINRLQRKMMEAL